MRRLSPADDIEALRCLVVEFVSCMDDGSIVVTPGLKEDGESVCHHAPGECGHAEAIVARDARRLAAILKARESEANDVASRPSAASEVQS